MHRLESSASELHRFVARRVPNPVDAADIAQQTLLVACVKLDSCRGEDVLPWLFAIARHQIVDHYRASRRAHFVEADALAESEPALRTRPDAVEAASESRRRLDSWLDSVGRLDVDEQVAVLLADVYGHRDKDSAAVLGMSLPSFKLLLHGARVRLRQADGVGSASPGRPCATDPFARRDAVRSSRMSVWCRLGPRDLLALRTSLLQGVRSAVALLGVLLWPAVDEPEILALAGAALESSAWPLLVHGAAACVLAC